jgi:site-specific DNA-methyltransferase (adenine-specific)
MNVAYNMDCMEYMKTLPDKAFELAIVDPPYGINWMKQVETPNKGKNWKKWESKGWDASTPDDLYFQELFRVSRNQIIWGGNYFDLPPTPCLVIWDKIQEFSGATFEVAWTSFRSPCKAFRMARCEAYVGINKIHPTQKPVALYEWLLTNYAKQGDKILDTHLGSGSSRIACYNLGFDFVGCEIDEDYFKAQEERFAAHTAQESLFAGYDEVTRW